MQRLSIKYYRYIIIKIEAIIDKPSTLIFKKLKKAIKLKIMVVKGVK